MFSGGMSKGCRQLGLIDDISDMVNCQRSNISMNTDPTETLKATIRYKSRLIIYMTVQRKCLLHVNVSELFDCLIVFSSVQRSKGKKTKS